MDARYPLNLSSLIIVSTCTNPLKPVIILDDILSDNVSSSNQILHQPKVALIVNQLFCSVISGKDYPGNKYLWKAFKAFLNQKESIGLHLRELDENCHDKALLKVLFSDIVEMDDYEKYSEKKYRNKNILRPEIISVFKNVKRLWIRCQSILYVREGYRKAIKDYSYPLSMESLLSSIKNTHVNRVEIMCYGRLKRKLVTKYELKYRLANIDLVKTQADIDYASP